MSTLQAYYQKQNAKITALLDEAQELINEAKRWNNQPDPKLHNLQKGTTS